MALLTAAYRLIFRKGFRAGETVRIRSFLTIGRGQDNHVPLDDPALSRRHCTLYTQGAGAYIEDLGSTNGTRVNGETVLYRRPLRDGDVIAIGSTEIQFRETA